VKQRDLLAFMLGSEKESDCCYHGCERELSPRKLAAKRFVSVLTLELLGTVLSSLGNSSVFDAWRDWCLVHP